jgi:hypothetical protein
MSLMDRVGSEDVEDIEIGAGGKRSLEMIGG